jgi:hypothetical protein
MVPAKSLIDSQMKFLQLARLSCLAALLFSGCATGHDAGPTPASHAVQSQNGPTVDGYISVGGRTRFR